MDKQLIIWGGGTSIKEGLSKGLIDKIKDQFVIGLNYSFNHFKPTCQIFVDNDFYLKNLEGLSQLPLVIGKKSNNLNNKIKENTILLSTTNNYKRDLSTGVYKGALVGYFALSIAIHILDEGEIFLLGYDFGGQGTETKNNKQRPITHYYQGQIEHRGCGKTNYYTQNKRAERDFAPYLQEKKIKIYNVSLNSRIPESIFPKISYDQFFKMLVTTPQNQDQLRSLIKEKLKGVK